MRLLFDTNLLIDFLRGAPRAKALFEASLEHTLMISVITISELYAGVREEERETMNDLLSIFEIMPLDRQIAQLAGEIKNSFGNTHGIGLADAMIAATAKEASATLYTLNAKHFRMFDFTQKPY